MAIGSTSDLASEYALMPTNYPKPAGTPHIPQRGRVPSLSGKDASIWYVGPRRVIAAVLGVLLYGLFSHVNLILILPMGTLDVFLPALLIPLFFGVIFGPWVGLVVGGFGFLLGDYVANTWLHDLSWNNGYFFYASALINFRDLIGWNGVGGYLVNAMIGLVAGLAGSSIRRYNTGQALATVGVVCAAGITVGTAIVVYSVVWFYGSSFYTLREATSAFFDTALPNLLFALVVLPMLLFLYDLIKRG
jgi:energy-coupling factor transport system substrate-specific component